MPPLILSKNIGGPSTANVITNEIGGSIRIVIIIKINILFVLFNCKIIPSIISNRFSLRSSFFLSLLGSVGAAAIMIHPISFILKSTIANLLPFIIITRYYHQQPFRCEERVFHKVPKFL